MCISVNPAEFNSTVIANYPAIEGSETERILSYMNSAESYGTSRALGIASTGPNAMIFPIYGEVTSVSDCPNPEASRQWLSQQGGVYREIWDDGLPKMRGGGSFGMRGIQTAGNYLVGIASDVENIPETLQALRQATSRPENVPEAPDSVLEMMDSFYRAQGLGVPQFVIAAFALAPGQVEQKNPITLQYTQSEAVADKLIFPALDYHGQGEFEAYVTRDHRLLFATEGLNEAFGPAIRISDSTSRPAEFSDAPTQFPVELKDLRKGGEKRPAAAPNNDYIFDGSELHQSLARVAGKIKDAAIDPSTEDRQKRTNDLRQVGAIITEELGSEGLMQFSNQAATTAQEYAGGSEWSSTLRTDNY